MTYSIHSPNDADLLVKFMDELEKKIDNKSEKDWNKEFHPSVIPSWFNPKEEGRSVWNYTIDFVDGKAIYANHTGIGKKKIHLTNENFSDTLNTIFSA